MEIHESYPPSPSATSLITVHGYGQLQHTGLSPTPVGFARVSPPLCVYDEEKPKGGKNLVTSTTQNRDQRNVSVSCVRRCRVETKRLLCGLMGTPLQIQRGLIEKYTGRISGGISHILVYVCVTVAII